jgi:hypothetical protein
MRSNLIQEALYRLCGRTFRAGEFGGVRHRKNNLGPGIESGNETSPPSGVFLREFDESPVIEVNGRSIDGGFKRE